MVTDEELVKQYQSCREQLNDRVKLLVDHSPKLQQRRTRLIILCIFLISIATIGIITTLLYAYAKAPQIHVTENNHPITQQTETIIINKTHYAQPEYTANCVKVKSEAGKYLMMCDQIKDGQ
ncbi:TPA: hypothetical protein HA278_03185 [Candidatus Woesearchaeota archaeon]|jgi:hypothetical protein|nr:hypothetical protein [Candidatus Woesearchaeota archaeon]|tara:strand:- start:671 stop:1036 length:366 start_codon:yes stop_codon:yes gene_type:complete